MNAEPVGLQSLPRISHFTYSAHFDGKIYFIEKINTKCAKPTQNNPKFLLIHPSIALDSSGLSPVHEKVKSGCCLQCSKESVLNLLSICRSNFSMNLFSYTKHAHKEYIVFSKNPFLTSTQFAICNQQIFLSPRILSHISQNS